MRYDYTTIVSYGNLADFGEELRHEGNLKDATRTFKWLLEIDPQNIHGYLLLAEVFKMSDRNNKAIKCLRLAQQIDPDNDLISKQLALLNGK